MEGYPQIEVETIYHSSHLHALQLIPASDHGHHHTRCCDPTASTMIHTNRSSSNRPVYGCRPCNFYIHKNCAELLPFIRHPSHPSHTLTLLHASPYLEGTTECDACCKPIGGSTGFSYHCTNCSFDLHTHCAFLPTTFNSPTSHPHLLSLRFSDAFSFTIYKCDLCRRTIPAKVSLYYCVPCDFQAHTDCVLAARQGGSAQPRPAGQPPNPLMSGSTPAMWPGQVGGSDWPLDGQPSTAASQPPNPRRGLTSAIWPGQVGAPGVSSGLGEGHGQATAPALGTQGNSFEEPQRANNSIQNHSEGSLGQASDHVGNSSEADGPGKTTHGQQQSANDGGMSDFVALQLEMMKLQVGLNSANTVNNFISNYTWRPRYW